MSLHLGNLSSHTRQDELERVFRRFGLCDVQLKDKFGFVVYDIPTNAEKALRTLRGKKICGEPITLSWSKKQPKPIQRSTRGIRIYEPPNRRQSGRERFVNRKFHSIGKDYRREKDHNLRDAFHEEDGRKLLEAVDGDYRREEDRHLGNDDFHGEEQNISEHDRWGKQVSDPPNGTQVENGLGFEFDRYEPHQGDGRRSQEELETEKIGERISIGGKNFKRFDHQHEDELKRYRSSRNSKWRKNYYEENKQKRRESKSPERYRSKKAKQAVSATVLSDYTASRSWSSSSRYGSTSQNSRLKNAKSRLRSNSPTSLTLSVSLSSPNKAKENQDSITNVANPEPSKDSIEFKGIQNSEMEKISLMNSGAPTNSTAISSDEMLMVLKHYGLEQPDRNIEDLTVEGYFGCARFWPWEIVYYRRLKKGPVSTENYARRIAQNQEFGIVDKYVRSSSGWGQSIREQ